MKYISGFNESFIQENKKKAIQLIISFLNRNGKIDLYEYDEIWHIQKKDLFLDGQLFISLKHPIGIRFNWKEGDLKSDIHSIDLWNNFIFDTKPDYTLDVQNISVANYLPQILSFIVDPKELVKEELDTAGGYDPKSELENAVKKLGRLKSPKSIEIQQRKIKELQAAIAYDERSETESEKINQLDDDMHIDIFKSIELYTIQVARGKSNSLIISGDAGIGKTQTVKDTLESLGMRKDVHYYFASGTVTPAGLYEVLFLNRRMLTVFDDCDAVFKDPDSVNMLKAALDTYDTREISKLTKGNTFNSIGMDDNEIQEEYETSGKLPNKFEFVGQIIFISNLPESKFDNALLSRSLHVDVHLSRRELFERMSEIMKKLSPDVDITKKEEALEYLTHITENYPTKFDLNIRTLIHSINLRANNEDTIVIGGKEEFVWKLLVKKYLIKSK